MIREWILLLAVVVFTTAIALGAVRWFAPQLLGVPIDLQSVQVGREIPAFYDGVFRSPDREQSDFLLLDPYTRVRAKPFYPRTPFAGPHDVLGFRNRTVPNAADIVVIGDSQTYGNNVFLEFNWPNQMSRLLERPVNVYSMATGGWSAVQYLDMFNKSLFFRPQLVVVAFYSGNDPMEAYILSHGTAAWHPLRVNTTLDDSSRPPKVSVNPPVSEQLQVDFGDGIKTIFTPSLRLVSNDIDYATVREGWAIMGRVAEKISELANQNKIAVAFTIIPSKELAYKRKIENLDLEVSQEFERLVQLEAANVRKLENQIKELKNVTYIDVITPLQQEAIAPKQLYPENVNGHPVANGYAVIAKAIAPVVDKLIPRKRRKLAKYPGVSEQYFLIGDRGVIAMNGKTAEENGWSVNDADDVDLEEFSRRPFRGFTHSVNPEALGPDESVVRK